MLIVQSICDEMYNFISFSKWKNTPVKHNIDELLKYIKYERRYWCIIFNIMKIKITI